MEAWYQGRRNLLGGKVDGVFRVDRGDAMLELLGSGEIYATSCDIYMDNSVIYPGGNINLDPEFTAPGSDIYTIPFDSPCTDTGTNSGVPALDFEDDDRPYNYDSDMGADEYVPS